MSHERVRKNTRAGFKLGYFDPIQSFPECGGIDIFMGTVRNHHEGKAVKALKYTSYKTACRKNDT